MPATSAPASTSAPAADPDPRDLTLLGRLRYWLLNASLTQQFGPSSLPGEPSYLGYADFHKGVDLVYPRNATIFAPASGRVIASGIVPGWGGANVVKILAPNGFTYTMAHFASVNVRVGDLIRAGQAVGVQGHTGYVVPNDSRGDHVHLEITAPNGQAINPGRDVKQIFWTLSHGLGFGLGYSPVGYPAGITDNTPPDPQASPLAILAGVIRGLPFQAASWQEPEDTASGSGSEGPGSGTGADPCGPMPFPTDTGALAQWFACRATHGGVVPSLGVPDIGKSITTFVVDHVAEIAIGGLGLILLISGLKSFTSEAPVKVVVEPAVGIAKGAAGVAAKAAAL